MNSWCLITGASTGIGKDLAKLFATDKVNVILIARSENKLIELSHELKETFSINVETLSMDLTSPAAVDQITDFLESKNIHLDYLVNNAGVGVYGDFSNTDWQDEEKMIHLNILTLTHLTKKIIPKMKAQQRGKILNVASTAAFQPGPGMAVYFATKAYVLSFSEALNEELKNSKVSITTLCPGPTETEFFKSAKVTQLRVLNPRNKLMMSSQQVAKIGYQALMNNQRVVVAGLINKVSAFSTRILPRPVLAKIVRQLFTQG